MPNHPVAMFEYHIWASRTIMERIQELPASVLHAEVGSSFPTIAHALSHMYAVDRMFYQVLQGKEMPEAFQACMSLNQKILDSIEDYMTVFAALTKQYQLWFQSEIDLEQSIRLDNPFCGVRQTYLSEIVLHVVNHGTYHRGNISTMLRQLGHASTMNDYLLYWYQGQIPSTQ